MDAPAACCFLRSWIRSQPDKRTNRVGTSQRKLGASKYLYVFRKGSVCLVCHNLCVDIFLGREGRQNTLEESTSYLNLISVCVGSGFGMRTDFSTSDMAASHLKRQHLVVITCVQTLDWLRGNFAPFCCSCDKVCRNDEIRNLQSNWTLHHDRHEGKRTDRHEGKRMNFRQKALRQAKDESRRTDVSMLNRCLGLKEKKVCNLVKRAIPLRRF